MSTADISVDSVVDEIAGSREEPVRPVIGVSAHSGPVQFAGWETKATLLPQIAVDLVAAVGCVPVLLPPLPGIEEVADRLDGLLLPGGGDVDPGAYGAPAHAKTERVDASRDAAEFALLEAAFRARLPVLGVCRGMQVLNVFRGGTLHQHLPDLPGNPNHAQGPGGFASQSVRLESGSLIARTLGGEQAVVPCRHHQGVDRLGDGLTATAWSQDGIVEAVELADYPFVVGVQWEVVAGGEERLLSALAAATRQALARRRGNQPG